MEIQQTNGIIANTFQFSNTKIITPMKIYDPSNEFDQEYFEFGLFMSRREYKVINRRLQNGRFSSAKEGKFVGSRAPYGYNKIKLEKQKGYSLEINQEQANIVKIIFDMFTQGLKRPLEICDYLNSISAKPPKNNIWSVSGVREILRNPTYCGKILYNERVTTKQMKDGHICASRHMNHGQIKDFVCVKGLHEPIIAEETFKKAEELRKARDVSPLNKNYALTNPLSGIVYCKLCGKKIRKAKTRGKNRLFCYSRECNNVSIFLEDVENKILLFLESWLKNKNLNKPNSSNNVLELKQKLLNSKKTELDSFKKKQERIYDLFEDGTYNKETFIERNEKITTNISKIEKEINLLENELLEFEKAEYERNNFIPTVKSVLKQYKESTDIEFKNKLLKTVIDKVYYEKREERTNSFELWVLPKLRGS